MIQYSKPHFFKNHIYKSFFFLNVKTVHSYYRKYVKDVYVCVKLLQSCPTLCDSVDCSPPGSLSMGFSRQEHWSGLLRHLPADLPDPGIEHASPAAPYSQADSLLLNHWGSPWKVVLNKEVGKINPSKTAPFSTPSERYGPAAAAAKSLQSCPTLCDPIDGSPPGSPVPGILQARTLEWVAIYFSNARKWKVKVKSLSCVWLFATPWTAAHQAPLSMGFSRQECWSGLPLPSPMVLLGPLKWEWLKNCPNTTSPVKLSLSLILTGKTNPASPPRSSMGF